MELISVFLLSVFTSAAAIYAQYRLGFLIASRTQTWWARGILLLTGIAFGLFAVKQIASAESHWMQLLIFIAAWGMVHIPAAIILFLKQQQRKNS